MPIRENNENTTKDQHKGNRKDCKDRSFFYDKKARESSVKK